MDLVAYLDWAALRPMTELEYEKIARGSAEAIVPGEYAWGSTSITTETEIDGAPEDGTETVANVNANVNYNVLTFSC